MKACVLKEICLAILILRTASKQQILVILKTHGAFRDCCKTLSEPVVLCTVQQFANLTFTFKTSAGYCCMFANFAACCAPNMHEFHKGYQKVPKTIFSNPLGSHTISNSWRGIAQASDLLTLYCEKLKWSGLRRLLPPTPLIFADLPQLHALNAQAANSTSNGSDAYVRWT